MTDIVITIAMDGTKILNVKVCIKARALNSEAPSVI